MPANNDTRPVELFFLAMDAELKVPVDMANYYMVYYSPVNGFKNTATWGGIAAELIEMTNDITWHNQVRRPMMPGDMIRFNNELFMLMDDENASNMPTCYLTCSIPNWPGLKLKYVAKE